ncbi:PR-1-like protein, partial [Setomelanomma holmii]
RPAAVPNSSVVVGNPLQQPSSATRPVVAPSSSRAPAPQPSTPSAVGPAHISGPTQATFSSGPDYQAAVLYRHNTARANHGAGPLVWDTTCEANARLAAQTCTFAHYIPTGVREGQNIFTTSGNYINVTSAITEFWYKSEFPHMVPYFGATDVPDSVFHSVGHLTQMLWKGTTSIGCVSLDCGNSMVVNGASSTLNKFTVCNYAPPGNIGNEYGANVGLPISSTNLGSWLD